MGPWVHLLSWRMLWAFVMNCDLINSKKDSTVIKFWACIVNVWRYFSVKYYVVKVFNVECNLSNKLRNHSFMHIRLYELFYVNNSILNLSKDFRCIPYKRYFSRFGFLNWGLEDIVRKYPEVKLVFLYALQENGNLMHARIYLLLKRE